MLGVFPQCLCNKLSSEVYSHTSQLSLRQEQQCQKQCETGNWVSCAAGASVCGKLGEEGGREGARDGEVGPFCKLRPPLNLHM